MRYWEIISEEGLIVPGINTTPDVQPGETARQAAKLGFTVDANGIPPLIYGGSSHSTATSPKMRRDKGQIFYGKNGAPANKNAPRVVREGAVLENLVIVCPTCHVERHAGHRPNVDYLGQHVDFYEEIVELTGIEPVASTLQRSRSTK
jgi:hypothetical protein